MKNMRTAKVLPQSSPQPSFRAPKARVAIASDADAAATGFDGIGRDIVPILLDLTYYQSPSLVSAAFRLLVRNFEQRKVLYDACCQAQLLVRKSLCDIYSMFDLLISQLHRLAERPKLSGGEYYQAAWLMGQLTMFM